MAGSLTAISRKIPKEVQDIFERYITDGVARRLEKPDAIYMLMTEFNLTEEQAEKMFCTFDQDKNEIFSIWEFQQFYQCVGNSAAEVVDKFLAMDTDHSGYLDIGEAQAGLQALELSGGKKLEDREIQFFLKSTLNDQNQIDLGEFAGLLYKLRMYEKKTAQAPPKRGRRR